MSGNRRSAERKLRSGKRPASRHPFRRPVVPGRDEQRLDTDYDPDPALESTPSKNAPQA
jgi:hypothetical protein